MSDHPDFSTQFKTTGFALRDFINEWADSNGFFSMLSWNARTELVNDLSKHLVRELEGNQPTKRLGHGFQPL